MIVLFVCLSLSLWTVRTHPLESVHQMPELLPLEDRPSTQRSRRSGQRHLCRLVIGAALLGCYTSTELFLEFEED